MDKKILISIIFDNNLEFIKNAILEIQNFDNLDLLIIDDGSDYDIIDEIKEFKFVKCIQHEETLGFGACINTAITFARDLNYNYLLSLNPEEPGYVKDIPNLIDNLDYGYDIVTCSRILENSDYDKIDESVLELFSELADFLNSNTGLSLTDPLSLNKGYNIETTNEIDLTAEDHGVMLQLFIQCVYFGYNTIEIPAESGSTFGKELEIYDNLLENFIALIETEKYLYHKGPVN